MFRSLKCGDDSKTLLCTSASILFPSHREQGSTHFVVSEVVKRGQDAWITTKERNSTSGPRDGCCSGSTVQRRIVTIPSWRVAILIKQDRISRNPSKVGFHQGVQKLPSIDRLHRVTEACVAGAEGHLHVVEPIGHGIDCIDHKSHFGILNVMCSQSQRTCWETNQELTLRFNSTIAMSMPLNNQKMQQNNIIVRTRGNSKTQEPTTAPNNCLLFPGFFLQIPKDLNPQWYQDSVTPLRDSGNGQRIALHFSTTKVILKMD